MYKAVLLASEAKESDSHEAIIPAALIYLQALRADARFSMRPPWNTDYDPEVRKARRRPIPVLASVAGIALKQLCMPIARSQRRTDVAALALYAASSLCFPSLRGVSHPART
jgi:hypothetical protein